MICGNCGSDNANMVKQWHGKHGKVERCDRCYPALRCKVSHVPVGIASERMETLNPQRDSLRALEYAVKFENPTAAQVKSWRDFALTLPDRNTPLQMERDEPPVTIEDQVAEREVAGAIEHLWSEAQYERNVLHKQPETPVQAENYAMVDRWESGA